MASSDFDQLASKQGRLLQRIARNNAQITTFIKKIDQNPDFATRVTQNIQENTQLLHEAQNAAAQLVNSEPSDPNKKRRAELTKRDLAQQFEKIMKEATKLQKMAQDAVDRAIVEAKKRQDSRRFSAADFEDHNSRRPSSQRQEQLMATEAKYINRTADVDIEIARERTDQLIELESNFVQLREIMMDLNRMVHEQGETIDNIEENVDNAQAQVEDATKELKEAVVLQKKARWKTIFLYLLIGLGVGVIALLIFILVKQLT